MNLGEATCAHCKQIGIVGKEIVAYAVKTKAGKPVIRWLHGSHSGKDCAAVWHYKYHGWLRGEEGGVSPGVAPRSGEVLQQSGDGGARVGSDDASGDGESDDSGSDSAREAVGALQAEVR